MQKKAHTEVLWKVENTCTHSRTHTHKLRPTELQKKLILGMH